MAAVPHCLCRVIESLLLFCKSQLSQCMDYSLWVSFLRSSVDHELNFKVSIGGLGSYYTDGASLIQAIVQSFDSVKSPLGEESTIVLMCRRIGDCNNVSMYTVVIPGVQSCNASLPMESVVPCPLGFTGFTLELTKVSYSADSMEANFLFLEKFLRLLQIVNPQMTFYLDSNLPSLIRSLSLDPLPWINILSTSFRLSSTLISYTDKPTLLKQTKIKLFHSSPLTVNNCRVCDSVNASFKVSCYAGVMPHFRLSKGKRIPADRVCSELKVSLYGPGNIPLFPFGSSLLDIDQLFDLSSYNIQIADRTDCCRGASFCYDLVPSQRECHRKLQKRALHIFIFIEECFSEQERRSEFTFSPDQRWKRYHELTSSIRRNFGQFLPKINKTLQRAIRLTLNKVICNYGSSAKINAMISSAIPVLSDAVSTILRSSNNSSFQDACSSILNLDSLDESDAIISEELRSLTKYKLNMTTKTSDNNDEPQSKYPDEPSTPELEQAEKEQNSNEGGIHVEQVVPSSTNGDLHTCDNDSLDDFNSLMMIDPFSLEIEASSDCPLTNTQTQQEVIDVPLLQLRVSHSEANHDVNVPNIKEDSNDDFDQLGEMMVNGQLPGLPPLYDHCERTTCSSNDNDDPFKYTMDDFVWD